MAGAVRQPARSHIAPLLWLLRADYYRGTVIGRVDVAAVGPHAPVPPGIPRLPDPGQFFASPALTMLLHTVRPDQLGDRYPGTEVGTIGSEACRRPTRC